MLHIPRHILHIFEHVPEYFAYVFPYSAFFLNIILHIMRLIRRNNPVSFVHWLYSTRTRQAWTTSGLGQHQGSSLVTHKGLEPIIWTLDPRGDATLVWPVVPNPCLPDDDEIVESVIQLVLISDLKQICQICRI